VVVVLNVNMADPLGRTVCWLTDVNGSWWPAVNRSRWL